MITRIHMQDQVTNRINELTKESHAPDWNEILQNIVTAIIVGVFLALGLYW